MSFNRGAQGGTRGGMPFILAQTVIFQLNLLEGTLGARINHISLIHSEVKAIIDAKPAEIKLSEGDISKLYDAGVNIETLREAYEPFLDDPEAKNTGDSKRKSSEKLIDISRYTLMYIIEKYKLIDVKTLQEITGVPWGE
jgi:hypothetical protein